MNEFFDVTLGEVVDFFNGKAIKPGQDGEYPAYGSNGLIGGAPDWKYENSIIIGRVGAYCGSVAYCKSRFWASDNTIVARPKSGDVGYFYYLLKALELNRYAGGAAQPLVTQTVLKGVPARVPDIPTQRRIASILSAYDDLIENNTRRIAILEEMARRIYEEWFVRFRFPGHEQLKMVESELGLIPEGWVAAKLGSLIEFKKGKKPALVSNQWSDGLMPHLLIDSLRGADRSEFVTSEKMVVTTPNDTIMVMDGSGSCDVFIGYEGVIGSTLGRYRVSELSKLSPYWLYLFFVSHLDEIKAKNIGAAIPHANKDFINGMTVPLPMHEISNRFDQTISPIFELVRVMKRKNKNLRATRDLLLPKLISGELDVSTLPAPEEAIAA